MKQSLIHEIRLCAERCGTDKEARPLAKQVILTHLALSPRLLVSRPDGDRGATPPPSAREILDQVRLQQSATAARSAGAAAFRRHRHPVSHHPDWSGDSLHIRESRRKSCSCASAKTARGSTSCYQNSTKKFSSSRLDEKIGGTGVTYGDLALKFLYWPDAQVIGADTLRTRNCWKLRLTAPSKESPYATVLLWVDKESGALMRMEGYDWKASSRSASRSSPRKRSRALVPETDADRGNGTRARIKCNRAVISKSKNKCAPGP